MHHSLHRLSFQGLTASTMSSVLSKARVGDHRLGQRCTWDELSGSPWEWEAGDASSILGDGVGYALSAGDECTVVEVVDVIASLVVASIVWLASLSTEQDSFFGGLDTFGTHEDTTSGDTDLEETLVVRSAVEGGGDGFLAVIGEEIDEGLFNEGGSIGSVGRWEGGSISVVDSIEVVGGSQHIEVEVHNDLGCLFLWEVGSIVSGSEKTIFFSRPPRELDGVVNRELCESLGNFNLSDSTGSIIVDTRSSLDGVSMSTDANDLVLVTTLGGSKDVRGEVDLLVEDVCNSCGESASSKLSNKGLAISLCNEGRNDEFGDVVVFWSSQSRLERGGVVVPNDETSSTGGSGESVLQAEVAASTVDESNLPSNGSRVVRLGYRR